jgi:hypothetical protein
MALAGPLLNVMVARAGEPKLHLAAFWIAFAILVFAQSACLVLQQVTVALLGPRNSPGTLVASASIAGFSAMAAILLVARTAFGDVVLHRWIATTAPAADLAREVLARLAPIPVLVAVRSVANGVAVLARRTTLLAGATIVRILAISGVVAFTILTGSGSGALAAATALLLGVALEAAFIVGATFPHWRERWRGPRGAASHVGYRDVVRMGAPLAVTTLTWTLTRPVANAILGRLPDSDLAQASFGVILPIVLLTCSPLWGFLEVTLVLPGSRADLRSVTRFATGVSLVFAMAIGLLTLTPLRHLALQRGFHLTTELERAVTPALGLIALEPFVLSGRAVAQAVLMSAKRTGLLLLLSPVKLLLMIGIGMAVVAAHPGANGALLAIGLVLGGDLTDAVLYGFAARHALARGLVFRAARPPRLVPSLRAQAVLEPASVPGTVEAPARRAA